MKRGAFSSASILEMAAGAWCKGMAAGGMSFCVMMVLALTFMTAMADGGANGYRCQSFRNSISRHVLSAENLDECSRGSMTDEHFGFAGLALRSLSMEPFRETDKRSVVCRPEFRNEPNTMLHMPKPYGCLACECNSDFRANLLHREFCPD